MIFEYNPDKSRVNKDKHGIDFEEAQSLWEDVDLVEVQANTVEDELRMMAIGKIGDRHWSAVTHKRANVTRIISVRRSRTKEIEYYESK